jgi:WD40 repeat protein
VALKIIKLGMDTRVVIARFEAERQALALMNHPNVAKVFEAGTTEQGRPYFVMEYVKGVPITAHCDRQRLTTKERLEIFTQVCDGVQHAHQKAIIHRDLKPSNVLVAIQDEKSVPKIIDFGVAKAIEHRLTERTLFTELGQIVGTPEYMSPEQAEMTQQDIDTRTDVYSLGVILYELLVGALPFDPKELRRAGFDEIRRRIREEEPSRPSTRVTTLDESSTESAKRRRTDPANLARQLRGDLDWITMKALEKDRTRRYETASRLAVDIEHHLAHEPVVAGPPRLAYKFQKFMRRNRVAVSAAGLVVAALALGLVVAVIGFVQASRERDRARSAEREARRQAYSANIAAARAALSNYETAAAQRRLDAAPREFRNWEWRYLDSTFDDSLLVLRGHDDGLTSVAFSPDDTRLASASYDDTVRLWDMSTGEELAVLRGHGDSVNCVAFSPDGNLVASGSGDRGAADNTIRLWEVATGKELAVLEGHRAPVWSVAFSPDGKQLASASGWADRQTDNSIRIWDATTGAELAILQEHQSGVGSVTFSPDGEYLAWTSMDSTVHLWDRSRGKESAVLRGHENSRVSEVAFSPDGKRLASASWDKTVRVWETGTGEELTVFKGHEHFVMWVAYSPEGTRLASGSSDGTVRLWNASSGEEQTVFTGHESDVTCGAFNSDGTRLASGSWDGTVRVWDAARSPGPLLLRGSESWIPSLAFSPDGTHLAAASGGDDDGEGPGSIHIWDTTTGEELAILRGHNAGIPSVAFSPDGSRLASGSWDRVVRLWDAYTGKEVFVFRAHEAAVWHVVFSPDGTRLASASGGRPWMNPRAGGMAGGTVRLWDTTTGEELTVIRGHEDYVCSVAFNPDGTRLFTASGDGTVRVWDALTGNELRVIRGALWDYESSVFAVAFSPDATQVATRDNSENTIHVCSLETGQESAVLRGHEDWIQRVAFSPDGTRLASGSTIGTIRIWDPAIGEEVAVLRGQERIVQSLAFDPTGRRLAAAPWRVVQLWDTVPYRVRYRERQAILAARPETEHVIDELRAETNDWERVVQRLRTDATLREPLRRAALNEVLRRSALAEERAILAVRPEAEELIDDLWRKLGDWASVAERLRGDTDLNERVRRVALNEALGSALVAERLEEKMRAAQDPDVDPSTLNEAAWLLLTCEPERLRDPAAALPLAVEANETTGWQNAAYLDTLAVAYHLTGDTERAIETQRKAISLLPEDADRSEFEKRLAEFEAARHGKSE